MCLRLRLAIISPRLTMATSQRSDRLIFMPLLLLQANPALPEITIGQIVATLILLGTCLCSLVMILVWAGRISRNGNAIPVGNRQSLTIGPGLLASALFVATAMAALVLVPDQADAAGVNDQNAIHGAPELARETESDAAEDGKEPERKDLATSDSDDAVPVDTEEADKQIPAADKGRAVDLRTRFLNMFLSNLTVSLMIGGVFGAAVWLRQQGRSRALVDRVVGTHEGVESAETFGSALRSRELAGVGSADPVFDADSYSLSRVDSESSNAPTPPWQFGTEFRFALETFLAAYLPTVVLKLTLAFWLPESKSHPFLEMIRDGIDPVMMLGLGFMAVFVAPVTEELLYRVTIFGGFVQQRQYMLGMIVSSVIFSLAHGFPDSIALLPLAFVLAYTYSRRHSYRTVVLVHFLFNLFNMVLATLPML